MARDELAKHDITVICDLDVAMVEFGRPLESLLSHWGWDWEKTQILVALDPDKPRNRLNGVLAANTGFMVVKNTTRVADSLAAWWKCPEEIEGCARWAGRTESQLYTDQGAWNEFIRPTLNVPGELLLLPCSQANGNPSSFGCTGEHVRHYWMNKRRVIPALHAFVLAGLAEAMNAPTARDADPDSLD